LLDIRNINANIIVYKGEVDPAVTISFLKYEKLKYWARFFAKVKCIHGSSRGKLYAIFVFAAKRT
jgi:hypothetical protein